MIDTVVCPACCRSLRVPDTLLGQMVKCPVCEQTFSANEELEPAPRRFGQRRSPRAREQPKAEQLSPNNRPRYAEDLNDDDHRRFRDDHAPADDNERRFSRAPIPMPGKARTVAALTLVGGIVAVIVGMVLAVTCVGLLWPGTYYTMVTGVLCILKGSQLLSPGGRFEAPPLATSIMQIVNIINLDFINVTLGILNLVFISDPDVRRYFRG
jgi:hypothetical protein